MSPFRMALLNLWRHPASSLITIVAMSLSIACGGLLIRLHQVSQTRFSTLARTPDAVVGAKSGGIEILLASLNGEGPFPDFLPYKLFESLRSQQVVQHGDGVTTHPSFIQTITPFVYFGLWKNQVRVIGTDATFLSFLDQHKTVQTLEQGRRVQGRWIQGLGEVVVGATLARSQHLNIGDAIVINAWTGSKRGMDSQHSLKVVGILPTTGYYWDHAIFSSVEQAHAVFELQKTHLSDSSIWGSQILHFFLVRLKDGQFPALQSLVNQRTVAQAIEVETEAQRLTDLTQSGKNIGLILTLFIVALGGLSVCSTMVARFDGMSVPVAILRAIGYTKQELSLWMAWEGVLITLSGVLLGALIDSLSFPFLRDQLGTALPSPERVPSFIFQSSLIWLCAFVGTMISLAYPILKMVGRDAHQSLRGL